jgi:hypothetical protein
VSPRSSIVRIGRSSVRAVVLSAVLLVMMAGPAAADPAAPTNYTSTVRAIEPATNALSARVVGGDSFLQVRVAGGHEVIVLGYDNEPYLRIAVDGTVDENERSPAVVLNQARYGRIDENSSADSKAAPQWKRVGSGGTFAWHDHRIHWMSSTTRPSQLNGASSGPVFDWTVPVTIDGAAATIKGDLYLREAPSKLPYVALGALAFAVFAGLMWWRRRSTALVLAACSLAAFVASLADQLSIPAAVGRQFSLYFTPGIALVCALVALARPSGKYAAVLRIGAALVLPLWIFRYTAVLSNAVLPGDVSPVAMRAVVVVAIAALLAFVVVEVPRELRGAAPRSESIDAI